MKIINHKNVEYLYLGLEIKNNPTIEDDIAKLGTIETFIKFDSDLGYRRGILSKLLQADSHEFEKLKRKSRSQSFIKNSGFNFNEVELDRLYFCSAEQEFYTLLFLLNLDVYNLFKIASADRRYSGFRRILKQYLKEYHSDFNSAEDASPILKEYNNLKSKDWPLGMDLCRKKSFQYLHEIFCKMNFEPDYYIDRVYINDFQKNLNDKKTEKHQKKLVLELKIQIYNDISHSKIINSVKNVFMKASGFKESPFTSKVFKCYLKSVSASKEEWIPVGLNNTQKAA